MSSRYIRQQSFYPIGAEGQEKLANSRVLVVGLGALGTVTANNLARAGIGFIRLVDRDYVELNNLQRQVLFTEQDAAEERPKAIAALEHLRDVNSEIHLEAAIEDVNSGNIDTLIQDVDLIMDATDNFEVRMLINEASIAYRIPWIYGGVLGAAGMTMNFIPGGDRPCFACLMGTELEPPGSVPTCATAGILNTTTSVIASLQCTEAIKILIASPAIRKELLAIDIWNNTFDLMLSAEKNQDCPICAKRQFLFYGKRREAQATSLCGRDSVQIVPQTDARLDFQKVAERLKPAGKVAYTDFVLDFDDGTVQIKLFQNGRAIVKNAKNPRHAKSVYNEYIGL